MLDVRSRRAPPVVIVVQSFALPRNLTITLRVDANAGAEFDSISTAVSISKIGVVHTQQDILDWIVGPCMGDKVAVRNVSGRQERHHPLQVAVRQLRAVRHGTFAQ